MFSIKYRYSDILWKKNISFIYSVDKTLWVFRIMDLNPHATVLFSLRQFRLIKCRFFIYSSTPNIHSRLASLIRARFSDCTLIVCYCSRADISSLRVCLWYVAFPGHTHLLFLYIHE